MSYCVNCGVELEKGCPACPLCDTPVINPREKKAEEVTPAFPEILDIPKSLSKKYWAFVLSLIILIPNLVLIVLDALAFNSGIAKFIAGGFAVAWVWFIFPLLWKKNIPVVMLGIDALALLVYLNMFRLYGVENGWFTSIVLPVVIALWAICNIFIFWLKKPRSKPMIAVAVLGAVNIMSFIVEICMNMFYNNKLQIIISFVVTACCVSLMIFFTVMAKSRRLKAWVRRKFFV